VNQASGFVGAGAVPAFMGNAHPSIAPYEVFATADRPIIIAVGNDGQFAKLAAVLGAADLAQDERFATNAARVSAREVLKVELESRLAARGADEWQERITAAGVPCGPINDLAQGFALAERLGLGPIVDLDDERRDQPQRQVANPARLSRTPATYRTAPPRVGEDRAAVLALLGLLPDESSEGTP
jgi:crotonobetainyl-CoA:carnitine CoA-transferase CaiB-like acyl-CoA transferase